MIRRTSLWFVAAIVLAACSSDDSASAPTTTASSTTVVATTATTTTTSTTTSVPPETVPPLATDHGVSDTSIRVGLSLGLSGPTSAISAAIADAHLSYFEAVNEAGGIAGRRVELVVLDHGADNATHRDNYDAFAEPSEAGVVIIGAAGSDEFTAAIADSLIEDELVAVTRGRASLWAASERGANVLEVGTTTCIEAMNGVESLALSVTELLEPEDEPDVEPPTLAIVARTDLYGRDGAAGARFAAAELGLELVLDAELGPEADLVAVSEALVTAEPDLVWVTTSPAQLAQLIGGAAAGELDAAWAGSAESFDVSLLSTSVAPELDARYTHLAPVATWSEDDSVPLEILDRLPEARFADADATVLGWAQARVVDAVLREAALAEDLTRAGVVAAAERVEVTIGDGFELQSWSSTPSRTADRTSSLHRVDSASATPDLPVRRDGSTGLLSIEESFVGEVARQFELTQPCDQLGGAG